MNKSTGILLGAASFFAGMVFGFFLSPIKKGVYIGNNSGNNCGSNNRANLKDKKEDLPGQQSSNSSLS